MNDIETLNAEIDKFDAKYNDTRLETEDELNSYISDAEAIIAKYPDPEGEIRGRLGEFYNLIGCWTVVFGKDLKRGIPYYHKAIELCPNSWDIRFEYFTTLKEIIPDKEYSTPELIQDAIDCLTFCINYCTTPELKAEFRADLRLWELAWVYDIAGRKEDFGSCGKEAQKAELEIYAFELGVTKKPNIFKRIFAKLFKKNDKTKGKENGRN